MSAPALCPPASWLGSGLPLGHACHRSPVFLPVCPQVRPKTLIPDSLPITPGRDRPPKQPPAFQKATVVSIKNPSPALPTANNTVSHVPAPGSQPQALAEPAAITSSLSSAGVAYAIISTAPSNAAIAPSTAVSVVSDSIKVQPLLISADSKVRLRPPEAPAPGGGLGHEPGPGGGRGTAGWMGVTAGGIAWIRGYVRAKPRGVRLKEYRAELINTSTTGTAGQWVSYFILWDN